MPMRLQRRPVSSKGFPVPWFVAKVNDEWDFRCIGPGKLVDAYSKKLCWLCGEKLGTYMCFVIGPMCTVNRVSSEPPCHLECADYAVRACPFLNNPRMRRHERDMPDNRKAPAGFMIERNPGTTALWVTKSYSLLKAHNGTLFKVGEPTNVFWYSEGKKANRLQVEESVKTGLPILEREAIREGRGSMRALVKQVERAKQYWPSLESTQT